MESESDLWSNTDGTYCMFRITLYYIYQWFLVHTCKPIFSKERKNGFLFVHVNRYFPKKETMVSSSYKDVHERKISFPSFVLAALCLIIDYRCCDLKLLLFLSIQYVPP